MSGYILDEDIDKVRNATDLVALFSEHTQVKQRGHDFWCCCPFHNEKTPSCKIDPEKQLWYCFGCHSHGNVFDFVMKTEGVEFPDAVRELADRAHIELHYKKGSANEIPQSEKARLRALCEETARFYHKQLMTLRSDEANKARAYLSGRNLGGEIPKKWNLGFAPGRNTLIRHLTAQGFTSEEMVEANVAVISSRDRQMRDRFYDRIMFPICDVTGAPIAFGGRVIGTGEPKYLNSSDTKLFSKSSVLFGLDKAKTSMTSLGQAIVVEGYTDVIAMHEGGLTNTVATLGTALTKQHIRVLRNHAKDSILYLFDGDAAGQHAIDRALQFISVDMTPEAGRRQIQLLACTIPDDMDPAEYIGAHGGQAMRDYLKEHSKPLIEFGFEFHTEKYHLTADSDWTERRRAFNEVVHLLLPIADTQYAAIDYARDFAQRLRVPGDADEVARQAISDLRREKQREDRFRARRQENSSRRSSGAAGEGSPAAYAPGAAGGFAGGGGVRSQQRLTSVAQESSDGKGSSTGVAGDGQDVRASLHMNAEQRNEAAFERAFIRICAENPLIAQTHADVLMQENWVDPVCKKLAGVISDALAANAQVSSKDLVQMLSSASPQADRILMESETELPERVDSYASYVAEELQIFDLQHQIENVRFSLSSNASNMSDEERNAVFQSVAQMQNMLFSLKETHQKHTM